MLKKTKKIFLLFCLLFCVGLVFGGCGFRETPPAKLEETIEIWGIWDDSGAINKFISAYKKENKQLAGGITYRKLTASEYEDELIKALAAGKGPDIFLAHNTWLARHRNLMVSLEDAQRIYNQAAQAKSGCGKPPLLTEPLITERQFKEAFVDTVYNDFTHNGQIYGIPLSVDTLALYYNDDLFAKVGIAMPPKTWKELADLSQKLTVKDEYGNITQAGVALGTSQNVNRASDILALLMMQYGTDIVNKTTFSPEIENRLKAGNSNELVQPALQAFNFYTSFSNASSLNYCWNSRMHNSIDLFQEGKAAMMINYTYAIENIETKAPKLNFKVAEIPQVEGSSRKITYPNYWGYVVSRKTLNSKNKPLEAWKFLKFLAAKEQIATYTTETRRPASRRDVISEQIKDPKLGIFAAQSLLARSWYQPNEKEIDELLNNTIESVALNSKSVEEGLKEINAKLGILLKANKEMIEEENRQREMESLKK